MKLQQEIEKMKDRLTSASKVCILGTVVDCEECPLDSRDQLLTCKIEHMERWLELAERFQRVREYCYSHLCTRCPLDDSLCVQIASLLSNKLPCSFYQLTDADLIRGIELIINEEIL